VRVADADWCPLSRPRGSVGRRVQGQSHVDQVVGDHPQCDPALHAVESLVATAIERVSTLEQTDSSFATGTPALGRLTESALALVQPALRALAALVGHRDSLDTKLAGGRLVGGREEARVGRDKPWRVAELPQGPPRQSSADRVS